MSLEKFTKQQNPDRPAVTIRKNGTLCINRRAIEEFGLQEMQFVTLHFDPDKSLFGIKPEPDNTDTSVFKVSKEKNRTFVISCQGFLKHCGIPFKEGSRVMRADYDGKAKMILVKIG